MNEMLFNAPWWAPLVLAAIGAVLFVTGNSRQETRVRAIGLAVVLLAIAYVGVSYYVDTPIEKAAAGTRAFVKAVVDRDGATLKRVLDPMASLTVLNSATPYSNAESITAAALQAKDQFGLTAANILSLSPKPAGTVITVTVDILSEQDSSFGRPISTSWQFEWASTSEGWLITRITCLRIGNAEGDAALRQFPAGLRLPTNP